MFVIGNDTTIRIVDSVTGKTEKLLQGEVDIVREGKTVNINLTNTIELKNDNLNIYKEEKEAHEKELKLKMKHLQKLLDENKYYYIYTHCFGQYYTEEDGEYYRCDQCGDWNGSEPGGTFKELFLGDVTSRLGYSYTTTIEELEISDLFEVDEFDNYVLKDESVQTEVLNKLMNHAALYSENICFAVEDEDFSIPMNEVSKQYIKDALIQLMSRNED